MSGMQKVTESITWITSRITISDASKTAGRYSGIGKGEKMAISQEKGIVGMALVKARRLEFEAKHGHAYDSKGFKGHSFYGYNCASCGVHIATLYANPNKGLLKVGHYPLTPKDILACNHQQRLVIKQQNRKKWEKRRSGIGETGSGTRQPRTTKGP